MNKRTLVAAGWLLLVSGGAAQIADLGRNGVGLTVETDLERVDPGRDFQVTVTAVAPPGKMLALQDLRDRFSGFQVAEDFSEEPVEDAEGKTTTVTRWRLVPEPFARRYRLAPFVVTVMDRPAAGNAAVPSTAFYTSPVLFNPPPPREAVTGGMEIDPQRDLPPLSWRLVGIVAACLAGLAGIAALVFLIVRKIGLMVRIHRMSPIERALYELEILLKKGLPGRGFYKDFYVELTMVVRRYIERRHAVRAPNLTTGEFLRAAQDNPAFTREALADLRQFLESADMVKFAGVEATPEMADEATGKARNYLDADNRAASDPAR
ncbi:MAG: hypothetical protein ACI4Q3_09020 [Kiritimatiellia bacterium]